MTNSVQNKSNKQSFIKQRYTKKNLVFSIDEMYEKDSSLKREFNFSITFESGESVYFECNESEILELKKILCELEEELYV